MQSLCGTIRDVSPLETLAAASDPLMSHHTDQHSGVATAFIEFYILQTQHKVQILEREIEREEGRAHAAQQQQFITC